MKQGLFTASLGVAVLIAFVAWFGTRSITSAVLRAGWAIPANTAVHLCQLFLSASAWRLATGESAVTRLTFFRIRLIREAINSLLPVAQIGGPVVGVQLMARSGIVVAQAAAATTLDITLEAAAQVAFILLGLALLGRTGISAGWAWKAEVSLVLGFLGLVVFVLMQRAGLLQIIEAVALRLGKAWPSRSLDSVRGLHQELMRLYRKPWVLVRAIGWHLLSWSLGAAEVYLALLAIGSPVSLAQAFIIESLGTAARSAGFFIPGALGVQEGGFILVCSVFSIAPDAAIALSMVKRLREVLVGVLGIALWRWSEIKRQWIASASDS